MTFERGYRLFLRSIGLLAALIARPIPAHAQDEGIAVGAKAPAVAIHDVDGKPVDIG